MTGMSSLFTSYKTCSGRENVRIADGSISSVDGQGNIPATPSLQLSSVLHVPNFTLNLLPISHITKSFNCCVLFFPSHYVFQDMMTRKMIGLGCEKDGLYLLDSQLLVASSAIKRDVPSRLDELLTWHCH